MLHRYLEVAPYLLPKGYMSASHIWHGDLHAGNIFVENGHISCLIDWQGIWAAPLILNARHPRLVDYDGDLILKAPNNIQELEPDERKKIKEQMSRSIILYLYEMQIAKELPLLDKMIRFPNCRTRCDPVLFAGDTWDDDILPLRESLIRVERLVMV